MAVFSCAQISRLLYEKNANDDFFHPLIEVTDLLSFNPPELYAQGIDTDNPVRWFFSKLENGNRPTPNQGIWMLQGSHDYGNGVEKLFTHSINHSWHMKEYTLKDNDSRRWALYAVYRT